MDIELVNIDDRGSGYAVVHRDDGTSFGMQFLRAPVGDADALMAHLTAKANAAEDSFIQEAEVDSVKAPVPVSIKNLLARRTPIVRALDQETRHAID